MRRELDARGLQRPLTADKVKEMLGSLAPGDELVVLVTDADTPSELGALAAAHRLGFAVEDDGDVWTVTLRR